MKICLVTRGLYPRPPERDRQTDRQTDGQTVYIYVDLPNKLKSGKISFEVAQHNTLKVGLEMDTHETIIRRMRSSTANGNAYMDIAENVVCT